MSLINLSPMAWQREAERLEAMAKRAAIHADVAPNGDYCQWQRREAARLARSAREAEARAALGMGRDHHAG